jgi:hypothetical protein
MDKFARIFRAGLEFYKQLYKTSVCTDLIRQSLSTEKTYSVGSQMNISLWARNVWLNLAESCHVEQYERMRSNNDPQKCSNKKNATSIKGILTAIGQQHVQVPNLVELVSSLLASQTGSIAR